MEKIKLATIQTDTVDELLSKNKALTDRLIELEARLADLEKGK